MIFKSETFGIRNLDFLFLEHKSRAWNGVGDPSRGEQQARESTRTFNSCLGNIRVCRVIDWGVEWINCWGKGLDRDLLRDEREKG